MVPPHLPAARSLRLLLAVGTALLCCAAADTTGGEPRLRARHDNATAASPGGPAAIPDTAPPPGTGATAPSPLISPDPSVPAPPQPSVEPPPQVPEPPVTTPAPAPPTPPPRRPESAATTTSRGDGVGVRHPAPTPSPPSEPSPGASPSPPPPPSRDSPRAKSARLAPSTPEPSGTPTAPADLSVRYGHDPVAPARSPGLLRYAPSCALGLLAAVVLVLRLSVGWPRFPPRYRGRRRTTGPD
ncbi:hypothetical protein CLV63_103141 [Murinocardiopsis flavida]|uniref:Uncharacterized protein n=1 Tax=Murinocardiopsis flavida TaxID=645275 RepID=A0A2P8DQA7_9ACTN|nr:hypothetical protein [Murinocardiopsis flavida]PSK99417.1 hypothetical protein CLV63_103141 [Murinocardiopsis flavida]